MAPQARHTATQTSGIQPNQVKHLVWDKCIMYGKMVWVRVFKHVKST